MLAADEKPVALFNELLGLNHSRIESYIFAERFVSSATLKTLFTRLADTSLFCREQLRTEIYKLGGVPYDGTLASSSFFNTWLTMHEALMRNDMPQLVAACAQGEEVLLDAYCAAVAHKGGILNTFQVQMLEEQIEQIRADVLRTSNLRTVFTRAA